MIFQAIKKFYTPKVIKSSLKLNIGSYLYSNLYNSPKCASCYENKSSKLAQPYAHGINTRYGETNFNYF